MSLDYVPLTADQVTEAGALLAQRHQRQRAGRPELPARFEAPIVATAAIQTALAAPTAAGVAALRNGRLVAYLLGETSVQSWGRCGYVYLPGYALAEGESVTVFQNLYARLGDDWTHQGCFQHFIYLSALDTGLIAAGFDLGFGKQRVDALLDLRSLPIPEVPDPAGIEIRRAGPDDAGHLARLSDTIWRHQSRAPRWHPTTPEEARQRRDTSAETTRRPDAVVYLALAGAEAVGCLGFFPEEEAADALTVPPGCRYMTLAAIGSAHRGRGLGTALTWRGLRHVQAQGEAYCLTDWQSANLLAARFWPRFGFQPVAYRLARTLQPAIAWARG